MTDFCEIKRSLLEAEWQSINERYFAERRRKTRAKFLCLLGSLSAWAIMIVAVLYFWPGIIRTAQAVWRG